MVATIKDYKIRALSGPMTSLENDFEENPDGVVDMFKGDKHYPSALENSPRGIVQIKQLDSVTCREVLSMHYVDIHHASSFLRGINLLTAISLICKAAPDIKSAPIIKLYRVKIETMFQRLMMLPKESLFIRVGVDTSSNYPGGSIKMELVQIYHLVSSQSNNVAISAITGIIRLAHVFPDPEEAFSGDLTVLGRYLIHNYEVISETFNRSVDRDDDGSYIGTSKRDIVLLGLYLLYQSRYGGPSSSLVANGPTTLMSQCNLQNLLNILNYLLAYGIIVPIDLLSGNINGFELIKDLYNHEILKTKKDVSNG